MQGGTKFGLAQHLLLRQEVQSVSLLTAISIICELKAQKVFQMNLMHTQVPEALARRELSNGEMCCCPFLPTPNPSWAGSPCVVLAGLDLPRPPCATMLAFKLYETSISIRSAQIPEESSFHLQNKCHTFVGLTLIRKRYKHKELVGLKRWLSS